MYFRACDLINASSYFPVFLSLFLSPSARLFLYLPLSGRWRASPEGWRAGKSPTVALSHSSCQLPLTVDSRRHTLGTNTAAELHGELQMLCVCCPQGGRWRAYASSLVAQRPSHHCLPLNFHYTSQSKMGPCSWKTEQSLLWSARCCRYRLTQLLLPAASKPNS